MPSFFRQMWTWFSVALMAGVLLACGGGSGTTESGVTESGTTAAPFGVSVFAGPLGGSGNADGTGASARFNAPAAIAADGTGNLFVADTDNHTIRKITPAGVVTTIAGAAGAFGSTDGAGAAARFHYPRGIAADSAGNVYVADSYNNTIRKITPAGDVTTVAGTAGTVGSTDATGAAARFNYPRGLVLDAAGNVFVADCQNYTIRKITPAGEVTTFAGTARLWDSVDATGAAARFMSPHGLAMDSVGNIFVTDNNTIRKITPAGAVSTFAGTSGAGGSLDGTGASARFNTPIAIAVDSADNVFVADMDNSIIRKITPAAVVTTFAGKVGEFVYGATDGTGAAASFNRPQGLATDSAGNVFVADQNSSTIRKITPARLVTTFAGAASSITGARDGSGVSARFDNPYGLTTDRAGNVFVADSYSAIRKITPAAVVTTFAGRAGEFGVTDGVGAAARFRSPFGLVFDSAGNMFVTDTVSSTIRKITLAGLVTTFAGTANVLGSVDGTGAAARFVYPYALAIDAENNMFVAGDSTIRKITPAGVVTTFAGTSGAGGSADGSGVAASFQYPQGIAIDSTGNVFVADTDNSTIRKITPAGVVTTLAGTAGVRGSADGIGAAASFNHPEGLAADVAGNVFVADTGNATIRRITPTGVVTTVAGIAGVTGVMPGPLPARLNAVHGIAIGHNGILYVTTENSVVRIVLP